MSNSIQSYKDLIIWQKAIDAEGQSRQHTAEFRQFLYIALGSLAELDTQLIIAH
jgi:four helix bundle protein